ncbi:amino acid ABC transporter substrate-binding protein [Desulfolutivibrio sp.]|uniref:amino acid ABC transporter substrate-binding protein n=1 Tax=Desulfolutivibrio sp. TaxID=2773296 RepID=UPI002F967C35
MSAHNRLIFAVIICISSLFPPEIAVGKRYSIVVQADPHLDFARELCRTALEKAGIEAEFIPAPLCNERRQLDMLRRGLVQLDMMPVTPKRLHAARNGEILMIPVPLDRGMLGWRLNLLLHSQRDMLADVRSVEDLAKFTMGQGEGWMDVDLYEAVGIRTKQVRRWRDAEFVQQMKAGYFQLFPLGLEEALDYFLPHFQTIEPDIVADPYILVKYPWFRFPAVSAVAEDARALYEALQHGFDIMAQDGSFLEVFSHYKKLPPKSAFSERTVIEIPNPYYAYDLVSEKYRHLLYDPLRQ